MAAKKKQEKTRKDLTCFVVIGFGKKTDYSTGRTLDLDVTFEKLIRPAFEAVGIDCFRAIDVNVAGSIDKLMYHWLYQADFVIADLSTMNANVFYELGVRHAQRPNTTLIMAENGLFDKLPFDLSHTIIYGYEHQGDDIAPKEVKRFVGLLRKQLEKLLSAWEAEERAEDSPVWTYMPGMTAPKWVDQKKMIEELQARLAEREKLAADMEAGEPVSVDPEILRKQSLAMLVNGAEAAKNRKDYSSAIAMLNAAKENDPSDLFVRQRLALATYKSVEKEEDDEKAISALQDAERILMEECELAISTDPETLGLGGAVNKRLHERTGEQKYFDRSVHHYERGFFIKQDYYNGINVAFMYTLRAAERAELGEHYDAIADYGHANMIRRRVAEICQELMASEGFGDRGDREWVYQTLAQAHLGMGHPEESEKLIPMIQNLSKGAFDMETFLDQNKKLLEAMEVFERTVRVPKGPSDAGDGAAVVPAGGSAGPSRVAASPSVRYTPGEPIRIDLGAHEDRPVKFIEVTAKIEFE
jgi:tetratricopeptide (TPR) repeat protein